MSLGHDAIGVHLAVASSTRFTCSRNHRDVSGNRDSDVSARDISDSDRDFSGRDVSGRDISGRDISGRDISGRHIRDIGTGPGPASDFAPGHARGAATRGRTVRDGATSSSE